MTELKTYSITCDRCRRFGGIVQGEYKPGTPNGWAYASVHNCGMTGYTRVDLLCENCKAQSDERKTDA